MTVPEMPAVEIVESAEKSWGLPLQAAGCPKCGQAFLIESARLGMACPGCAEGRLEPQPVRLCPEPPELLAPFQRSPADLRPVLERFVKPVWLRPDDFNPRSLMERLTPIYWPMWLVDSDLAGDWQAEMGYDYQVKSSQESTPRELENARTGRNADPLGARLGQLARHYDNVAAPALENTDTLTTRIGDTSREPATPYSPAALGQAAIRIPDLHPENAWPQAQTALHQAAAEECRQAAQAQHVRSFAIHPTYTHLHWTQLLQPMYATYYLDDQARPQVLLVNGQTGKMGGRRRASQRKGCLGSSIGLGFSVFLLLIYLLLVLLGRSAPALGSLAVLVLFFALGVAGLAVVLAAWPWNWNRTH